MTLPGSRVDLKVMLPCGLTRPRRRQALEALTRARLLPAAAVLLFAAPAAADFTGDIANTPPAHVSRTMAANGRVAAACPGRGVSVSGLALGGRVDRRSALAAALRENGSRATWTPDPLDPSTYTFIDDPDEAAEAMRSQYGPDSFITRGAQTVRALADVAGRGSQAPINGLGRLTDAIVDGGRGGRRPNPFAELTLEPTMGLGEAGLNLQTRW